MITKEEICATCGKRFIFREYETAERVNDRFKPLCPSCRALIHKKAEEECDRKRREVRKQKDEADHKEFIEQLKTWNVVLIDEVCPENDNVLFILGNGFDLMHCVPSSYYSFRDSLGKYNSLRYMLEQYITVEDIWADLENALAHFNVAAMANEHVVDMWLDNFEVYKEDSGAAEYAMSVEAAAMPIITVVNELPSRFRKWVDSLTVGTADRPLQKMFRNGKVLNFNYTEFVENLYSVSKRNVCYIHGCRVKQKGKPREPLILGHILGASDSSFELQEQSKRGLRGYKRAFVEMTQASVIDCITEYDEYLTKDTRTIIAANESFFSSLACVETIVAIGHSFSETDRDYFFKIKSSIENIDRVKWYFGCYGLRDLKNLEILLAQLEINKSKVAIFRTDTVVVTPLPVSINKKVKKRVTVKPQCMSKGGKWVVERIKNDLVITNSTDGTADYSVMVPGGFNRAFFVSNYNCLLVVMYGLDPGVLLFRNIEGHWLFVGELYCDHQHLLVSRLQHVFTTESEITFVYNNRIRKYSLVDSSLICNKPVKCAKNNRYDGEDITKMFLRSSI